MGGRVGAPATPTQHYLDVVAACLQRFPFTATTNHEKRTPTALDTHPTTKMPPKQETKKSEKAKLNMAVELHADTDMKRLLEAYNKLVAQGVNLEPVLPFFKRIRQEVQMVKDGEQLETPKINLFVTTPLDYHGTKGLFSILLSFPWLRHIQLYHCQIGNDGAAVVADYIKLYKPAAQKNPFGIETLEMPRCDIGPQGALYLGRVLAQNETIKVLNLDFNPLGDEGAANIGDGLKWNSTLHHLSLNYCDIGPIGGECVGKFIVRSSSVRELLLKGNALGPSGVTHIAHALAKNAYLTRLVLADTGFGVDLEAIEALRDGVESNDSLEAVDIDLNSLVPAGMGLLLDVVRSKPKLTQFTVYERISEQMYKDMLDAVANNVKLMKKKKKKGSK